MNYKVLLLSIALLSCFTAILYTLSNVASAGIGCGTNWMGDDTGDSDFSVSKNMNLGTSSDTSSSGATPAASKPAVSLGSTSAKTAQSAGIDSLTPNAASPQQPGIAIVWTASATNPGSEPLFYDFLLRGPATEDLQTDKTGWTAKNSWTWNTTNADAGENQVEVRIKYANSKDAIASKVESFTISSTAPGSSNAPSGTEKTNVDSGTATATATADTSVTTAGVDAHPASKTADSTYVKPRVAPDERVQETSTSTSIIGANMNMPDPTPKSPAQTTAETSQVTSPPTTSTETAEPKIMEVDGKWTVRLVDAASSMDLILIQTGKSLSGMGKLQPDEISLIATGTASENSFDLDVKTVVSEYGNKIDKRFKVDLVKVDRIVSGSYEAYSGEDSTSTGNATASRI